MMPLRKLFSFAAAGVAIVAIPFIAIAIIADLICTVQAIKARLTGQRSSTVGIVDISRYSYAFGIQDWLFVIVGTSWLLGIFKLSLLT